MEDSQVRWWYKEAAQAKWAGREMGYPIDEVAIMFPTKDMLNEFVTGARAIGMDNFNNVNDHVYCQYPRQGGTDHYDASYRFLQAAGADWRIEAMHATSKLHRQHLEGDPNVPRLVHVSYKCLSMNEFLHSLAAADRDGLLEEMFCASSYGLFSYRLPVALPAQRWSLGRVYLKPRLPWSVVAARVPLP